MFRLGFSWAPFVLVVVLEEIRERTAKAGIPQFSGGHCEDQGPPKSERSVDSEQ